MFYTGIGSRETPNRVCMLMSRFAMLQWRKPRSGGAIQADESQEVVPLELYLPRRGWRGKEGIWQYTQEQLLFADTIWQEAFPCDTKISTWTCDYFRRNVWQIMGLCASVKEAIFSDFVICWTPDGALSINDYRLGVTGGTGIAINIASIYGVPVYNLQRPDHFRKVLNWCVRMEQKHGLVFEESTRSFIRAATGEYLVAAEPERRGRGQLPILALYV